MILQWITLATGLVLAACAAPPVTRYTLDGPAQIGPTSPLATSATVIAISRVTMPDYLDTQDIVVRRGNVLEPSHSSRWATRLSLGATELIAGHLARTRPTALVTDQPQGTTPAYRLLIDISRFDLATNGTSSDGTATVEANWQIIPKDAARQVQRARARIDVSGPIRTDSEIVALTTTALTQLATAIDIEHLP